MPRAVGLLNPQNATKSTGSFKEGCIRIDSCSYKVHKGQAGEGDPPVPATKMSWVVTRLAESGDEPLLDEHDQPITEELLFSLGGKSLPFVHPGNADGPEDEEPEDLGTDEGASGNTIFLNAQDWRPHERSGIIVLMSSLAQLQVKSEYLNRCWAPDWVGCVFEMKTKAGDKAADGRTFSYKIVSKILVSPGSKKAAGKAKAAAVNGSTVDPEAEAAIAPILRTISEELDGQSITRKAFLNRVRGALDTIKVDSKLLVPILSLAKDDRWLAKNQQAYDYKLDESNNSIAFGNLPF
jgi:hypothetical protein